MDNNPRLEKMLDRHSGPIPQENLASTGQIRNVCAASILNIPNEMSSAVTQLWTTKGLLLKRRLRTLRYRPAVLYCGNFMNQFDEDYPKFGDISCRLQGEGLITHLETDDWQEIAQADMVLTHNFALASTLKVNPGFKGFWVKPNDPKHPSSQVQKMDLWHIVSKEISFAPNSDFEWQIRRALHNMRDRLMV